MHQLCGTEQSSSWPTLGKVHKYQHPYRRIGANSLTLREAVLHSYAEGSHRPAEVSPAHPRLDEMRARAAGAHCVRDQRSPCRPRHGRECTRGSSHPCCTGRSMDFQRARSTGALLRGESSRCCEGHANNAAGAWAVACTHHSANACSPLPPHCWSARSTMTESLPLPQWWLSSQKVSVSLLPGNAMLARHRTTPPHSTTRLMPVRRNGAQEARAPAGATPHAVDA